MSAPKRLCMMVPVAVWRSLEELLRDVAEIHDADEYSGECCPDCEACRAEILLLNKACHLGWMENFHDRA